MMKSSNIGRWWRDSDSAASRPVQHLWLACTNYSKEKVIGPDEQVVCILTGS